MKLNSTPILAVLFTGTAQAFNFHKPAPPPPSKVDGFEWNNPFSSKAISSFESVCESTANFHAFEYTLHDLMTLPPNGLKPWGNGLKTVFSGREYPGGWVGIDAHLHNRNILLMDYDKLPLLVREWIEEEERTDGKGKALFAIFDKPKQEDDEVESVVEFPSADKMDRSQDGQRVAIFAPGALYGILPLWAAGTSDCKGKLIIKEPNRMKRFAHEVALDVLSDLGKYKATPEDNGVVAWVKHTQPDEKKMIKIEIKANSLKAKAVEDKHAKESKEAEGKQAEDKEEKTASRDEL
ncbi:hypothetical protein BKA56DRAFT_653937 [Ilyonectria sp. MPI-CAGE-AT-0026]|nr:hypothetical protein BKA56DRAFT_653937 [Ilyonectria sp. MPI-CAGE-AT-0026]